MTILGYNSRGFQEIMLLVMGQNLLRIFFCVGHSSSDKKGWLSSKVYVCWTGYPWKIHSKSKV